MKKNYIAGEWLGSDGTIENINPSDISDVIASYAQADVEQTNLAIEAADHARETWSRSSLQIRSDILDKIGKTGIASLTEDERKKLKDATKN